MTQKATQWSQLLRAMKSLGTIHTELDHLKLNQGTLLSQMNRGIHSDRLSDYEFKIFSQWGEDGIIQHLTQHVPIAHRTFIEFGVEDFSEANCRFLMMKDYWSGYVMDGSSRNIERLRSSRYFWKYRLDAVASFVTRENVEALLRKSGFDEDLGLLSIDIDGVDYHVLARIESYRPRILVVEYNAVFGKDRAVSVPYRPDFQRSRAHHSNLYYGASLRAFNHLASLRGYGLAGVNGAGSNAFFVRRDIWPRDLKALEVDECFRDSCFRESRDERGHLSLRSGNDRRRLIADLPLVDVVSGVMLKVGDIEA